MGGWVDGWTGGLFVREFSRDDMLLKLAYLASECGLE